MTSNLFLSGFQSLLLSANSPYSELQNSLEGTFSAGLAIICFMVIIVVIAVILVALDKFHTR
jgi:hypothetical protein